jgi:hypothetical protein
MFAITSRTPAADRVAERLTSSDCSRCGLREPAWIVLDEYNICVQPALHDFISLDPLGKLSSGYLKQVSAKAREAIKSGRARGVLRN